MTTLERITAPPVTSTVSTPRAVERSVVAIEFPDVFRAHEAMLAAARLERRLSIVLNDAAVVTRSLNDRVRINRGGQPTPLVAGLLTAPAIGFPFLWVLGPLAGLIAAAAAAAVAVFWARRSVGLHPRFLRRVGARLAPGHAAGCFLVSHAHLAHVLAEVRRFEGSLLHSTLPEPVGRELAAALAAD